MRNHIPALPDMEVMGPHDDVGRRSGTKTGSIRAIQWRQWTMEETCVYLRPHRGSDPTTEGQEQTFAPRAGPTKIAERPERAFFNWFRMGLTSFPNRSGDSSYAFMTKLQ